MRSYLCQKTSTPLQIDADLEKSAWKSAEWTDDFVDIEGDIRPKPRFRTRAKMLWDDSYLYIAAELEEPHIWGTLTEHDSVIFRDNDFEVFIDPDGDNHLYGELELNVLNTTWDLLLIKPYRDGGPPVNGWEIHGLKTATKVFGTLNDPSDTDHAWTVEIAIPWKSMAEISRGQACPPKVGDQMRINFSRVEWHVTVENGKYHKVPNTPEDNWVWSPHGVVDMHRPELFGVLQFADGPAQLRPYPGMPERDALMRLYHAQHAFKNAHGHFATTLADLQFSEPGVSLYTTPSDFEGVVGEWHVNGNSRLWHVSEKLAERPTWD